MRIAVEKGVKFRTFNVIDEATQTCWGKVVVAYEVLGRQVFFQFSYIKRGISYDKKSLQYVAFKRLKSYVVIKAIIDNKRELWESVRNEIEVMVCSKPISWLFGVESLQRCLR